MYSVRMSRKRQGGQLQAIIQPKIQKILECPICLEILFSTNIFTCTNGEFGPGRNEMYLKRRIEFQFRSHRLWKLQAKTQPLWSLSCTNNKYKKSLQWRNYCNFVLQLQKSWIRVWGDFKRKWNDTAEPSMQVSVILHTFWLNIRKWLIRFSLQTIYLPSKWTCISFVLSDVSSSTSKIST